MITKIEHLKSNYLDIHKIERKQLSIQFSLDGFSFSVFDIDLEEFIVFTKYTYSIKNNILKELLASIKQIFLKEELLKYNFERVLVVHVNNLSAFVPFPIFDEDNLSAYVSLNNKIYQNDYFVYDLIVNQDMVSVFAPYVNINNFLIEQFGSFEYKHYSSILVENLLNNYTQRGSAVKCFININKSHFELIIGQQKKLILYNTFDYNTKEDFIYYVLFTFEQLQLNVEEIEVIILGEIDKESELFLLLYKYINKVNFLEFKSIYNAILEIDNVCKRENFCLFNTID